MELYYKVIKIDKEQPVPAVTYQKDYKSSEPLFARRAAIEEAEKLRDTVSGNDEATIVVALCFSPAGGLVYELPIHFIFGNEDLHLLIYHSWPLESSLYYQYQHDTGGDIANYMGVLVLPDAMEQVLEDHF